MAPNKPKPSGSTEQGTGRVVNIRNTESTRAGEHQISTYFRYHYPIQSSMLVQTFRSFPYKGGKILKETCQHF